MVRISSTKNVIFIKSIELFSKSGYENVSMRDIAKEVGIKASSIYNHYSGKELILEAIYDYYEAHFFDNRPSRDQMRAIIETGTYDDIISGFIQISFIPPDDSELSMLALITKIVYARIFSDSHAGALFNTLTEDCVAFIQETLDYGIELGKFEPFDTRAYAFAFTSQYIVMGMLAFTDNGYKPVKQPAEDSVIAGMKKILTDKG